VGGRWRVDLRQPEVVMPLTCGMLQIFSVSASATMPDIKQVRCLICTNHQRGRHQLSRLVPSRAGNAAAVQEFED
jgi:hypothetical protein